MDLDGDGITDILSGSYSRMEGSMAGTFQVLYGNKDKTFRKAETLNGSDGKPLIIPGDDDKELTEKICTRPFAIDFNGDGKLDLVVGNFTGTFYVFKGEGKGKFAPKPEKLLAGKDPLKIPGVHSDPFVIDFDGDGDLDIVSGSSDGGVYWSENTAGKGKPPVMTAFKALIKAAPKRDYDKTLREADVTRPTYATRVWVADVNGDGKPDLLVGDMTRLLEPAKGLSEEDYKKKKAEWQGKFQMASEAISKAEDDKARKKAQEEYQKLYEEKSKFVKEEMTGFVWVYLRK